ncbi:MAG: hypothetical protein JOY80_06810, partial [Candidatus Dormibacteraeota bacterium]|nr:hypothetical protein [Candidatus Dormibacteraeota bacterium]
EASGNPSVNSSWDWKNTVARDGTTTASDSTYSLVTPSLANFLFTDANTTNESGAVSASSSFSETMTTAAVGLALNGVECESYSASNSGGPSYQRTLLAAAGNVIADEPVASCSAAQSTSTPASSVPETPAVPALFVVAALLLAPAGRRVWRRSR